MRSEKCIAEIDRDGIRVERREMSLSPNPPPTLEFEVFYDGGCPLCRREINLLKRWDRAGRICFTDIDSPEFNPEVVQRTKAELMAEIHGRSPDGTIVKGVEVFRRLYSAVGCGWLVAVTRWPGVSHVFDVAYTLFARNRLRLTGRCTEACRIPAPVGRSFRNRETHESSCAQRSENPRSAPAGTLPVVATVSDAT